MRAIALLCAGALACSPAQKETPIVDSGATRPVAAQAPVAREVYIDSVKVG